MVETAQARDVDLLCFAGGEVEHPDAAGHSRANAIYDLVDREHLDGLVLWGSSLGYYAGPEATLAFCRRFRPLPMVSIGVALPGIPGIVLDSYGGMCAVLSHLIEIHGRRRLAFIRGPAQHREARERYRAYCDALAAHGLPFDPELVSPPFLWIRADGAELQDNGAAAVQLFLEQRGVPFDALVAASDTFMLGALPALQARGIRVPEQVAVAGFDDKPAIRLLSPPLTTVRIHMRERGRQALAMLLAQLAGEPVPDELLLPARLVIRRSCGCPDSATARTAVTVPAAPLAAGRSGAALDAAVRSALLAQLGRGLEAIDEPPELAAPLLDACLGELAADHPGRFLAALDDTLNRVAAREGSVWAWQEIISVLREHLLPLLAGDARRSLQAEDLWHQARVRIGERAWRAEARASHYAGEQSDRLQAIGRTLALAGDIGTLLDILARTLPTLGISLCCLALYEDAAAPARGCRLMLAYDENGRTALPPEGQPWRSSDLASGGPLLTGDCQRSIVVEPLYYRDEPLGFIMLDGSRSEGQLYRVIQEQVSSALKGVLLLEENRRLYLAAVEAQGAAVAAQHAAQEKQRLAEDADQLKSRFLSMVSHELRTPLILLEGLSEMMLREGRDDRPPMPAPYRQDLAQMRATAQQLSGLVRDVLDLARSQVGQLRLAVEPLDIAAVLQPTLLIGAQMARDKGLNWRVECATDLPPVLGDPARLQEVTLNLISNAVKFTGRGEVRVHIDATRAAVTVSVSDTGLGVPLAEQQAIFDEFRQSERTAARGFGGLGVGLAICRRIVELHGGTIGVDSSGREDSGSRFFFTLPVPLPVPLPALPHAPRPAIAAARGDAGRVVLLTDEAAGGALLHAHLLAQGYAVEWLTADAEAEWLPRLIAAPPAAVVLDLPPEGERGWQLVDALKRNPATQDIPVLLYSLLAGQDAGALLALDYVSKPMAAAALEHALQNLGVSAVEAAAGRAILIVDDDPAILALHRDIVAGHFAQSRILLAADGRQALDVLQRGERPLFILLDLMMPELDGIGVLEAMQRDAQLRDIPVVVLTAQRLSEADMGRLNRGVAAILQKGMFSAAEMCAQIERSLARSQRLSSEPQRLVRQVMAYIHAHYAEDLSRARLAAHAGLSERHLTRCFVAETGIAPLDYLNRYRMTQARRLLDTGNLSVTEVMHAVGFANPSHFSRIFRREVGVSPSAYRHNLSQSRYRMSQ